MNRKLFAIAAVGLMLACSCTVVQEDTDESDAFFPALIPGAIIVASWIGGMIAADALNIDLINHDGSASDDVSRKEEAKLLATSLTAGVDHYGNALSNYAAIWKLTKEHWTRQAELASSALWTKNGTFDTDRILECSHVYSDSACLIANSTEQINEHLSKISDFVSEWNSIDRFKNGLMEIRYSLGTSVIASGDSNDDLEAVMGTALTDVKSGSDRAYLAGGKLWASQSCAITDGTSVINLNAGWNTLADVGTFPGSVYTFKNGVSYVGNILPILGSNAAEVRSAMILTGGSSTKIITSDGTSLYCNGLGYPNLKFSVVPDRVSDTQTVEITKILNRHAALLNAIYYVMQQSASDSHAVWSIYDDLGQSSAYITTLTIPTTYANVSLSTEQRKLMTILAMDQLSDTWKTKNKVQTAYSMTSDSLSLYCRGSISIPGSGAEGDLQSKAVASDVVFTPIFYVDTELRLGNNTNLPAYGFVVVWGPGESLSGYTQADIEYADIYPITSGMILSVDSMYYGGQTVTAMDLDATTVDYIKADTMQPIQHNENPDEDSFKELVQKLLLILGALLILAAILKASIPMAVLGAILVICSVMFADPIADALEKVIDILNLGVLT